MVNSELQIYNLAVDAVGGTGTIAAIDERSREAELCGRWFGPIRDKVLRAAAWQSAKKYARLAQLAERDDELWSDILPSPAYPYAFATPADMLIPRYLTEYIRFELSVRDENTHMISTSVPTPILCYTARIAPNLMEGGLADAVVAALAAAICEPLTGATRKKMALLEEANNAMIAARLETSSMDDQVTQHVPDFISARGYGTPALGLRYLYPSGPLLTAGDIGG